MNEDDKSMPLRDEKTGFCVPADFGEVGYILFICVYLPILVSVASKRLFLSVGLSRTSL